MMQASLPIELISGGDCPLHFHESDREVTHTQLVSQQGIVSQRTVTDASYTVTEQDDVIRCDTTSNAVTITLTRCFNGKEYQIVKIAGSYDVNIVPDGTDTIMGDTSAAFSVVWTSWHLKATDTGNWILI